MPGRRPAVAIVTLAFVLLLAACAQPENTNTTTNDGATGKTETTSGPKPRHDPGELAGTEWELISLNGREPIKGTRITLNFHEDAAGGISGCNSYSGKVTMRDGIMKVKAPGFFMTEMACGKLDEGVMLQEENYLDTLANGAEYSVDDDRLKIRNAEGKTTLVYAQRSQYTSNPADLAGTEWMLRSINGEPPTKDSTPTLLFESEKEFSGYDGCQHFQGVYDTNANDVVFLTIGMAESRCMKPGAYDEAPGVIGALPADGDYRFTDGRLEITTPSGDTVVLVPLRERVSAGRTEAAWELEKFVEEGKTTQMLPGTEITLAFDRGTLRKKGEISGSAGCNDYSIAYVERGDYVVPDPAAVTRRFCPVPANVMDQEQRYLDFLEEVHGYAHTTGGRLETYAKDGGRKLIFTTQEQAIPRKERP